MGGDVPPELDREALGRVGRVLLARGSADPWYTAEKFAEDQARLRGASVATEVLEFDGVHEWGAAVNLAAADFLESS